VSHRDGCGISDSSSGDEHKKKRESLEDLVKRKCDPQDLVSAFSEAGESSKHISNFLKFLYFKAGVNSVVDDYLSCLMQNKESRLLVESETQNMLRMTEKTSSSLFRYVFDGNFPKTQFFLASNPLDFPCSQIPSTELLEIILDVIRNPSRMLILTQIPEFAAVTVNVYAPGKKITGPISPRTCDHEHALAAYMLGQSESQQKLSPESLSFREKNLIHHHYAYRLWILYKLVDAGFLRCTQGEHDKNFRFYEILKKIQVSEVIQQICYNVFGNVNEFVGIPEHDLNFVVNPLVYFSSSVNK